MSVIQYSSRDYYRSYFEKWVQEQSTFQSIVTPEQQHEATAEENTGSIQQQQQQPIACLFHSIFAIQQFLIHSTAAPTTTITTATLTPTTPTPTPTATATITTTTIDDTHSPDSVPHFHILDQAEYSQLMQAVEENVSKYPPINSNIMNYDYDYDCGNRVTTESGESMTIALEYIITYDSGAMIIEPEEPIYWMEAMDLSTLFLDCPIVRKSHYASDNLSDERGEVEMMPMMDESGMEERVTSTMIRDEMDQFKEVLHSIPSCSSSSLWAESLDASCVNTMKMTPTSHCDDGGGDDVWREWEEPLLIVDIKDFDDEDDDKGEEEEAVLEEETEVDKSEEEVDEGEMNIGEDESNRLSLTNDDSCNDLLLMNGWLTSKIRRLVKLESYFGEMTAASLHIGWREDMMESETTVEHPTKLNYSGLKGKDHSFYSLYTRFVSIVWEQRVQMSDV